MSTFMLERMYSTHESLSESQQTSLKYLQTCEHLLWGPYFNWLYFQSSSGHKNHIATSIFICSLYICLVLHLIGDRRITARVKGKVVGGSETCYGGRYWQKDRRLSSMVWTCTEKTTETIHTCRGLVWKKRMLGVGWNGGRRSSVPTRKESSQEKVKILVLHLMHYFKCNYLVLNAMQSWYKLALSDQ